MKVAIVSNGNAFSTLMLRPVLDDPSVEVTGVVTVSVPGGRGSAIGRLAALVRRTGMRFATTKAATLLVPAAARLTGARPFLGGACRSRGVPVRSAASANDPEAVAFLDAGQPEVLVSVSCPERLASAALDLPSVAAINIHWAPLPAYAGIAPYFWVLRDGAEQTGLTVHVMESTLDTGPVLGRRAVPIEPDDTMVALQLRLAQAGAEELAGVIRRLPAALDAAEPQPSEGRSYRTWPVADDVRALRAQGRRLLRMRDLAALWRAVKTR